MTNLSLQFTATDTNHPLQQVELFLDGVWLQTLTNLPPAQNNSLTVRLNGHSISYAVPANATLLSVASNLTAQINAQSGLTMVSAFAHGDRIELQSLDISKPGSQVALSVSNSVGTASALTSHLWASGTNLLDTIAYGILTYDVFYAPNVGSYLQLIIQKTNNTLVTLAITNTASGTPVSAFVQGLVNMVNTNSLLQGSDGVIAEDFIGADANTPPAAEFNLLPRSPGWKAAEVQATLSGSSPFIIQPSGTQKLEQNLGDLQPRAHLYFSAGLTNLLVPFPFNTTAHANGFHQLTAVGYEGSHVRTQKSVSQTVLIQNGPLGASFTTPFGGSNVAVEATLPFTVVANTNSVTNIQLFSTGGLLTNVTGQSSATFYVPGTNLDLGLHPFYAIVTTSAGQQFRTATIWLRLVGADSPFQLSISRPPPTLSWPATSGRSYDILATTNLTNAFLVRTSVVPVNTPAQWPDTAPGNRVFYRVRTSP
jgi:hypothetical protein